MSVVLRDSWGGRAPSLDPFRWLHTTPGELLDLDVARQLAGSVPDHGFVRKLEVSVTRTKTYRNFSWDLVRPGEPTVELTGLWRELISDLVDPEYRRRVSELLGTPVADAVEIRLVRHLPGDWLGPHTDRPDKIFSHVLYFTAGWQPEWGGNLEILRTADPASVVSRVVPELGASALFARSDDSWHQVSPVTDERVPARVSLLIHGIRQSTTSPARSRGIGPAMVGGGAGKGLAAI